MVVCQLESIGDCARLSSKALPPGGVTRAMLLNSRIVANPYLGITSGLPVTRALRQNWAPGFPRSLLEFR